MKRLLLAATLLAGCGDGLNEDPRLLELSVEDGVKIVSEAFCAHLVECGRAPASQYDQCVLYNVFELCNTYIDCDEIATDEQQELIVSCEIDIMSLECDGFTPDSCLELFGVGEQ